MINGKMATDIIVNFSE